MESFAWFLITVIVFAAGLAVMHALAIGVGRNAHLHDLKVHVANLRLRYLQDLARPPTSNSDVYVIEPRQDRAA